jgi:hypothetical protein
MVRETMWEIDSSGACELGVEREGVEGVFSSIWKYGWLRVGPKYI